MRALRKQVVGKQKTIQGIPPRGVIAIHYERAIMHLRQPFGMGQTHGVKGTAHIAARIEGE
jgi:hypothetical protein